MKMALKDGQVLIKEADNTQFAIIKSWNKMKWNKGSMMFSGTCDMELLDKLAKIVRLPPNIEAERQNMKQVAAAVDRERMKKEPKPYCRYPVKLPLYEHQVRAANMALLAFGLVSPEEVW